MSSFTRFNAGVSVEFDSNASYLRGKDSWLVKNDFKYYVDTDNGQYWVKVYENFITDGATVPRLFWSLIPPWGRYGQAAILHDHLLQYNYVFDYDPDIYDDKVTNKVRPLSRREVDRIFLQAMAVLEVPTWKRLLMYGAVRAYSLYKGDRVDGVKNKDNDFHITSRPKDLIDQLI